MLLMDRIAKYNACPVWRCNNTTTTNDDDVDDGDDDDINVLTRSSNCRIGSSRTHEHSRWLYLCPLST